MRKPLELLMWGVVLALGVALLASYRMQHQGSSPWSAVNPDCDLQHLACSAGLDDGSELSLTIVPRPIVALKPLEFRVNLSTAQVSQLWLEISGVNMEMGVTRVLMQVQDGGEFSGEGMLPICSVSHMEWRIRVVAITPDGGFDRAFRLVTERG